MRRPAMRIEVLAGFPALDHHEKIGVVDAGMALIGDAAFLLPGGRDAFPGALDESVPRLRLHLRGGDDIDHGCFSRLFSRSADVDFFGRNDLDLWRRREAL